MKDIIGRKVRDKITGFEGVATCHVEYITGCNQVLIVPKVGSDGRAPDPAWYDEQRLETLEGDPIVLDNSATSGPDLAAPIRR